MTSYGSAQFSLDDASWTFVQRSAHYGFQNQDELIRLALGKLQKELMQLESSADLYAENYVVELELKALTNSAIVSV